MKTLLQMVKTTIASGAPVVLATVVDAAGSVPRGAGARMAVTAEGLLAGTIGGGAIEHRCLEMARSVLCEGISKETEFVLNETDFHQLGMICGGSARVYLQYIPGHDSETVAVLGQAAAALEEGRRLWLINDLSHGGRLTACGAEDAPKELLPWLTRRPVRIRDTGMDLFVEQIGSGGTVYIFGAGHVGRELEPLLSKVGFRCVVLDDRPDFADRALFPAAADVICVDYSAVDRSVSVGPEDYVCIMTRGHSHDTEVLAQVLRAAPRYVGLMGSRKKIAALHRILQEEYGITACQMAKLTAPIGLEIGARTPAEIAVSVAAQLIAERAKDCAR